MATYQSKKVTVVGDVGKNDPGFDQANPKVKIKLEDGTTQSVPKAEVTE